MNKINDLSDEHLLSIFNQVDLISFLRMIRVCKAWCALIDKI